MTRTLTELKSQIDDAAKAHRRSCRVMPHLWPAWHEWQRAEAELKAACKRRDDAKKAWLQFSGR